MIMNARLALEQIVLRLKIIRGLSDIITTMAPAVGVFKSVRTGHKLPA